MNLSEEERHRFAAYLMQEASTALGLSEQAQKLDVNVGRVLSDKLKREAAAMTIVARILTNFETMQLNQGESWK